MEQLDNKENDNSKNVEMSEEEIWLIKHLIEKYNPRKIVEIGISAGGNTVNLLNWKDDDAQLFSIDIAVYKSELGQYRNIILMCGVRYIFELLDKCRTVD